MQQQQQQPPVKKKKKIKVPRVVNGVDTLVEIEVDDEGGPVWGANDKHTLLNHRLPRVDGPLKATGAAPHLRPGGSGYALRACAALASRSRARPPHRCFGGAGDSRRQGDCRRDQ